MRILDEVQHPKCRISIFGMNDKYLLKVELGQLEQTFKMPQYDFTDLEELKSKVTPAFIDNCIRRFVEMEEERGAFLAY